MNEKKKKGKMPKYLILVLIFVVILVLSVAVALIQSGANEEEYRAMQKASLPTVSLAFGSYETAQTIDFTGLSERGSLEALGLTRTSFRRHLKAAKEALREEFGDIF